MSGESGQGEASLGRRISSVAALATWFLSNSVLCSQSLQPQRHISLGNELLWPVSHSTNPAVTSHQQPNVLVPFPSLYHTICSHQVSLAYISPDTSLPWTGTQLDANLVIFIKDWFREILQFRQRQSKARSQPLNHISNLLRGQITCEPADTQ